MSHCVFCGCVQTRELSDDQKAQLKQQAQKYESQLASNAADLEALEGAGVSYAQLGDFKQAETLLAKLTGARPTDPEAWRLLVLLPDLLRRVAAWTRHIPSTANYRSDNRMFVHPYAAQRQHAWMCPLYCPQSLFALRSKSC